MALPSDATKIHLDASTDDPKQARPELADLVDKYNALKNALGNIVELDNGEGLTIEAGTLKVQIQASDNISIDYGSIT